MWAYVKFRIQRNLHRYQRDLRLWRIWLINYLDRHVWGRWRRLGQIRRFIVIWWLILVISFFGLLGQIGALDKSFTVAGPAAGGIYREGLLGTVKSVNPILADSQASSDIGRLVFNGLTRLNRKGAIEADLALNWSVSDDGKTYTFHLRPDVRWHDGAPFTAKDVLFTLHLIQNPDTRSILASSWQGVTAEAKDNQTVVFLLPNPFAPFIYSTNFGILPQHILKDVDPASLRVADFNQHPVGTGPFRFVSMNLEAKNVLLEPNKSYYKNPPKVLQFEFKLFDSPARMRQAFAQHQINAFSQVATSDIPRLARAQTHDMTLLNEVGLFMRLKNPILEDKAVRSAISQSVDRVQVTKALQSEIAGPVELPILPGELGYNAATKPPGFDLTAARKSLDADGWVVGDKGVRHKDHNPLKLTLVTANVGSYPKLAQLIQSQLQRAGIAVEVIKVNVSTLQQSYIRPRKYDLLLYGISVGPDPDVYAFWHSSQATDPGLNLSQYSSPTADKELEAARLTSDAAIRAARYKKFLGTWSGDIPAVMLYEPSYVYITSPESKGIVARRIGDPSDRFYGVENWTINTTLVQRRQ